MVSPEMFVVPRVVFTAVRDVVKRFVEDAVVEKKLVEVAFESVVFQEKVFDPENVLLLERSVEEAKVQVDVEYE